MSTKRIKKRPYGLTQAIEENGAAYYRNKTDILEKATPEDIAECIEAFLRDRGEQTYIQRWLSRKAADAEKEIAATQAANKLTANRRGWTGNKLTGVLPGAVQAFFENAANSPGVYIGVNKAGRMANVPPRDALPAMVKRGDVQPVLWPTKGHIVLAVDADIADKVAARQNLPKTLTWDAEGRRHFVFRVPGGRSVACIEGVKIRVMAYSPSLRRRKPLYAALAGCKWVVGPNKALDKETGLLPELPAALADLVEGVQAAKPELVDKVLLG
jgi:hypothetical protein